MKKSSTSGTQTKDNEMKVLFAMIMAGHACYYAKANKTSDRADGMPTALRHHVERLIEIRRLYESKETKTANELFIDWMGEDIANQVSAFRGAQAVTLYSPPHAASEVSLGPGEFSAFYRRDIGWNSPNAGLPVPGHIMIFTAASLIPALLAIHELDGKVRGVDFEFYELPKLQLESA